MRKHTIAAAPGIGQEDVAFTADEEIARDAEEAAALIPTADAIKAEAERRINEGTLINGVLFKCDVLSVTRIAAMKDGPTAMFPVVFKTHTGVTVTVNNATEALAIFNAASLFVSNVLAASATLQDTLPADYADDIYWPA